MIMIQVKLID